MIVQVDNSWGGSDRSIAARLFIRKREPSKRSYPSYLVGWGSKLPRRGRRARVLGIISAGPDKGRGLVSSSLPRYRPARLAAVRANATRDFLYKRDILGCLNNAVAHTHYVSTRRNGISWAGLLRNFAHRYIHIVYRDQHISNNAFPHYYHEMWFRAWSSDQHSYSVSKLWIRNEQRQLFCENSSHKDCIVVTTWDCWLIAEVYVVWQSPAWLCTVTFYQWNFSTPFDGNAERRFLRFIISYCIQCLAKSL